MDRVRQWLTYAHRGVVAGAIVTILASLTLIIFMVFWQDIAEEWTTGRKPDTFNGPLEAELLDDYGLVFSVGHNSGDTLAATRQALRSGADVIEVDVASMGDTLVAAHFPPLPFIGHRLFRGPTLEEVWRQSATADIIKLDLKESSPGFRQRLFQFLVEHRDERQVIVATRDVPTLTMLMSRVPWAFRFLSVSSAERLEKLYGDAQLVATLDGVTIRQSLVTGESATRLRELGLLIIAWTVNDLTRVNELVHFGVDGITTDNLAIMRLLGGEQRGERRLREYRLATQAWHETPRHIPQRTAVGNNSGKAQTLPADAPSGLIPSVSSALAGSLASSVRSALRFEMRASPVKSAAITMITGQKMTATAHHHPSGWLRPARKNVSGASRTQSHKMRRCGWRPLQIPTPAGMIATERNANGTQISEAAFKVTTAAANSRSAAPARMRYPRSTGG
jgi:glycerophosphoryl diester phosphodiesterase